MPIKTIIIGASTTGKTTLLNNLKDKVTVPLLDSDEVLKEMNHGEYPDDTELKMKILAPQMVKAVLNSDGIIFFSNTHYFTGNDLRAARDKGFKIIQLSLDRQSMENRSNYRMKHQGYENHIKYFDSMENYQREIFDQGLVDAVVQTDKSVDEVVNELLNTFGDK